MLSRSATASIMGRRAALGIEFAIHGIVLGTTSTIGAFPVMASTLPLAEILRVLRTYPRRWLAPVVGITALALVYALTMPRTWEASQALIIRNEAAGNLEGPGKFRHNEEMKSNQATILEMTKSHSVLEQALIEVGPSADRANAADWPNAKDIQDLLESIKVSPPNGSEFGTTEILYLKVRDHSRERAVELASAVFKQLQHRCQELRNARAKSMIGELIKSVSLAETDLDSATLRLGSMEREVGSDLSELRALHDSGSGESGLRRTTIEVENEIRQAQLAHRNNEELLTLLTDAKQDHARLLATPNRLLESQPALRRLKEGLVDAQLRTAQLQGNMSDNHPQVLAAVKAEEEIRQHLHNELALAIRGLQVDLRLTQERVDSLNNQLSNSRQRMTRLAGLRAAYVNLVQEVAHRNKMLEETRKELADARSNQAAALTASLISTVDEPDTGSKPLSPGRAVIVLIGLAGGLLTGAGVLFLTVAPEPSRSIVMESHYSGADRRGNDRRTPRTIGIPAA
jgi:succinoglycan biosynthesis transport protein ExoP